MACDFDIRRKAGHWEVVDKTTNKIILTADTYSELMCDLSDYIDERIADD